MSYLNFAPEDFSLVTRERSTGPVPAATPVRSLWTYGRPGRIVRRASEHQAQIVDVTAQGATVVSPAIFQLGEMVILTANGLGHIPGQITGRSGAGIRIAFDPDPGLALLVADWHQRALPVAMI